MKADNEIMLSNSDVVAFLKILKRESENWNAPVVSFIAQTKGTSYRVLISTLLSLRTKDETTGPAAIRLFEKADTADKMLTLNESEIRELIYPVGFYKTKARRILEISDMLIRNYNGKVPDNMDDLLKLPGVGRKTANLVLILGYGLPGMCVDVHVHRISNRWGYVHTKTPEQTEFALRDKLPTEWWREYNDLLVAFGQTICRPVSPKCSLCPLNSECPKVGVKTHR